MRKHYVYILKCADGKLYTGYTVDPRARIKLHNLGKASKFTRSRLPAYLVHLERFYSKSKALRRESEIKKMPRNHKLKICAV